MIKEIEDLFLCGSHLQCISAPHILTETGRTIQAYVRIAGFPHHPISLITRNSSSLARTFLIYSICNSSIHFIGVSAFRCLRNLWMEHEELFWKDSFITKALTTQPKNKSDFIDGLQIEESNGTKSHCIIPKLWVIDNDIKKFVAFCFTMHVLYHTKEINMVSWLVEF